MQNGCPRHSYFRQGMPAFVKVYLWLPVFYDKLIISVVKCYFTGCWKIYHTVYANSNALCTRLSSSDQKYDNLFIYLCYMLLLHLSITLSIVALPYCTLAAIYKRQIAIPPNNGADLNYKWFCSAIYYRRSQINEECYRNYIRCPSQITLLTTTTVTMNTVGHVIIKHQCSKDTVLDVIAARKDAVVFPFPWGPNRLFIFHPCWSRTVPDTWRWQRVIVIEPTTSPFPIQRFNHWAIRIKRTHKLIISNHSFWSLFTEDANARPVRQPLFSRSNTSSGRSH